MTVSTAKVCEILLFYIAVNKINSQEYIFLSLIDISSRI